MTSVTVAEYLPANVQREIPKEDWEEYLEAWTLICHDFLILPAKEFVSQISASPSFIVFLTSYIDESARTPPSLDKKGKVLRTKVFLAVHRLLSSEQTPISSQLLSFDFFCNFSIVYSRSSSLRSLLNLAWEKGNLNENPSFIKSKAAIVEILEQLGTNKHKDTTAEILFQVAALLKSCYRFGQHLLAGSDFLDALNIAYLHADVDSGKKLRVIALRSLLSLLEPECLRVSTLTDHLYSLKAAQGPLLEDLCSQTSLIRRIRTGVTGPEAARADSVLQDMSKWEGIGHRSSKRSEDHRIRKGKGNDVNGFIDETSSQIHVHRMSLITQVQDIFLDLGSAFVAKLLDEYDENVEQVTLHLLEDSLPNHLKDQDRGENLPPFPSEEAPEPAYNLAPRSTLPFATTRKNIFDGDDFSRLAVSPSQLHYGRVTDEKANADALLKERTPESAAASKAAILSALAAFDSDDDERDDTYDVEDVGGTVDTSMPGSSDDVLKGEDKRNDVHEEALYRAWKTDPGVFERDSITRRGKARATLRGETGMDDEMIEGWAVMLRREPGRARRLEALFGMAAVNQQELGRSSWQESHDESDSHTETLSDLNLRGRGGFWNHGRGGRGDVVGPADERLTQQARQRKDQNKGSRANHNRRDQRARKMARGGFAG